MKRLFISIILMGGAILSLNGCFDFTAKMVKPSGNEMREESSQIISLDNQSKVYDGDTITKVKIKLADSSDPDGQIWSDIFIKNGELFIEDGLRFYGIDTPEVKRSKYFPDPELHVKAGKIVHGYLLELIIKNDFQIVISLIKDKNGKYKKDQYGRSLCDIWVGDINIRKHFIEIGFAKPYDGGTRPEWDKDSLEKIINRLPNLDID